LREQARAALLGLDSDQQAVLVRAIVVLTVEEVYGPLQDFAVAVKAAAAGAGAYGAFRTAIAAIPTPPERTAEQAKTAIENFILGGRGD